MAGFDGTGADASLDEGPQSKPAFTGDRLLAVLSVVEETCCVYLDCCHRPQRKPASLCLQVSQRGFLFDEETYCAAQVSSCAEKVQHSIPRTHFIWDTIKVGSISCQDTKQNSDTYCI